jgi:hypothetical protein
MACRIYPEEEENCRINAAFLRMESTKLAQQFSMSY